MGHVVYGIVGCVGSLLLFLLYLFGRVCQNYSFGGGCMIDWHDYF